MQSTRMAAVTQTASRMQWPPTGASNAAPSHTPPVTAPPVAAPRHTSPAAAPPLLHHATRPHRPFLPPPPPPLPPPPLVPAPRLSRCCLWPLPAAAASGASAASPLPSVPAPAAAGPFAAAAAAAAALPLDPPAVPSCCCFCCCCCWRSGDLSDEMQCVSRTSTVAAFALSVRSTTCRGVGCVCSNEGRQVMMQVLEQASGGDGVTCAARPAGRLCARVRGIDGEPVVMRVLQK